MCKFFRDFFAFFCYNGRLSDDTKLSYVALSGLALWVIPFYVVASPYAVLCRPFGACIEGDFLLRSGEPLRCFMSPLRGLHLITISSFQGLHLINDLGQLVYHYFDLLASSAGEVE